MNSFYGGKEGRSYAIIEHFNSTTAMVEAFKQGAGYTKVNYGEYVIIDTIINNHNPNDLDNGKIFRRGIDYTNDLGGAIYVGQIQGPKGKMSPITIMNMSSFNTLPGDDKVIIDGQNETIQDFQNLNSIIPLEDGGYELNKIEIGYKNYADNADGLNMESAVGISIPNPVLRVNTVMVQPGNLVSTHTNIVGDAETYSIDLTNLIHQSSLSSELSSEGVRYYDYQIAIPKSASNITVGSSGLNGGLQLSYQTVEGSSVTTKTLPLNDIKVVDGLRRSPYSDVYEYHLSGQQNWRFLGNPYGQFHVYANYNEDDSNNTFETSNAVVEFLNNKYPYGIRVDKGEATYDMSQAGWLISANYSTTSALYAFDYRPETSGSTFTLNDIASTAFNISLKGWYQIQNFESQLSNDPQDIILIGSEVNSDSYDPDYSTISPSQRQRLKARGVWFKAEDGEKWWT